MGGKCPHRSVKKRRYSHKTHRRAKFLVKGDDMVYDGLNKADEQTKPLPPDQDLPGMGQFYCLHCDRYFNNAAVRDDHFKTKRHRRRVKLLMEAPHTQLDADLAAGMGMPDNGPKLMSF
ncbi:zinc finger protein 593 [Prunus avium]|uniref:Zinc finger protein 593 n=2 Tax=Prunus TaxID=3754 RepID=A0A6P5TC55_PRUAV|nr:zinc finger protein 593 [Prunus avium]